MITAEGYTEAKLFDGVKSPEEILADWNTNSNSWCPVLEECIGGGALGIARALTVRMGVIGKTEALFDMCCPSGVGTTAVLDGDKIHYEQFRIDTHTPPPGAQISGTYDQNGKPLEIYTGKSRIVY